MFKSLKQFHDGVRRSSIVLSCDCDVGTIEHHWVQENQY